MTRRALWNQNMADRLFFIFLNTKYRLLKSGSEKNGTTQHSQVQTHRRIPSTDNSLSPIISIMSICETNSSSKSSLDICWDQNPQPFDYESDALPTELLKTYLNFKSTFL
jgi:hypothetical protein